MRPELEQAASLLRTGKRDDLERALQLLQRTVYAFSMKVCGHPEDAEDTMQDVLLKSLPYLRKLENPKALAVWLYKVTRNRCWMSRRRSKFAPKETLSLDELMPDATELEALVAKEHSDPESSAAREQESERVRQAILRIPPKYRLILVLHDMEDLDTPQVAAIMGLTEGTVRVRLHRARLFVRHELSSPTAPFAPKKKRQKKPLSCREMFAGLSEYLDGRLTDLNCERVEKHLQDCPPCVAFLEDLRRAVQRCRESRVPCESATAATLRKLLIDEYVRMTENVKTNALQ
ncbi:MAG TPA: sigma-70 family RNA polymerase sigma factor [Candidatus Acidoferrales bacterium]|nr:sigma-70 family RNA polymerase sigma factor [Candidatus Acidoferrales bacterium]